MEHNFRFKISKVWLKRIAIGAGALFALMVFFYFSILLGLWGKLPNKEELGNIKQAEASLVLDSNDKLVGKYFIYDRQLLQYESLPEHLINALIATEDVRFYDHSGVDYRSLFRVFFKTLLLQDDSSGGGSTITQQLVKNLYGRRDFGPLTVPVGKIKEMVLAKRLEEVYSKKEILELYLNTVPFSDNTFGIESAAMKFFDTPAQNLSLQQSATLVGSLKATHSYNPRLYPEKAKLRRDVVLAQMKKYGFISDEIKKEVDSNGIDINYRPFDHKEGLAPYFREKIRKDVVTLLDTITKENGEKYNIYKDGLRIYTTLDSKLQEYAEQAVKEHMKDIQSQFVKSYGDNPPWLKEDYFKSRLAELKVYRQLKNSGMEEQAILDSLSRKREMELFAYDGDTLMASSTIDSLKHYLSFLNTGLVAIEPSTGAIKTYVGGVDFEHFKFDHVSMAKRQVGSTFKPFVYTAAIESGMHPCTYFPVSPVTYVDKDEWTPKNSSEIEDDEHLNYSLEKALSHSVNTIAVKVLKAVRISPVIDLAHRMGINSDIPAVPSIALGTAELSLLELATAYTGYANRGVSPDPYFITKIEDSKGRVIYEYQPKRVRPAFSENTRQVMVEMMKSTVNEGTAVRMRSRYGLRNDIAGKTGTTQDNKDGWFVGIMPKLVVATWVGHDDHRIGFRNTRIGQGANSAMPAVALFLQKMNADKDYKNISWSKFPAPSEDVIAALDCEPEFRDSFFDRLFSSDENERDFGGKKSYREEIRERKAKYRKSKDDSDD